MTSTLVDTSTSEVNDTSDEPVVTLTAAGWQELRDYTRVRWQGWLAPLGQRAGDLRPGLPMPTGGRLKARTMPLPFFWQKETSHGGAVINGAVEVGGITHADIRPRPDYNDQPWIWGTGFIDLNDPEGLRYARRLGDRMSRWVSVRLDFDPDFEPPAELLAPGKDGEDPHISPTDHADWWRLMNLTAESQPAFDGAEIELLDDPDEFEPEDCDTDEDCDSDKDCCVPDGDDVAEPDEDELRPAQVLPLVSTASGPEVSAMNASTISTTMQLPPSTAEIKPPGTPGLASGGSSPAGVSGGNAGGHSSGEAALVAVVTGDTSLPIADRDTPWNGPEAAKRLVEWAGGRFKLDPAKMAKVFLYRDTEGSEKFVGSWKFPFADVIGGQVKIVPRAVFTAAAVLRGSMGGTKIPKADQGAMRGKINTLYGRMAKQFNDPKIRSPFEAVVSDAHVEAMRTGDSVPGSQPPWRRPQDRKRERRRLPQLTASAGSWAAQVAERVPEEPPRDWFADPGLTKPSKIRVDDNGRIFGHVAAWHTEHAAFPGVHPPRNRDKTYSKFHRHPVRCADGSIVKTGPLATGGHTATDVALAIETVQAHYDDPRYVVGDVVCGEDEHGIWVSGALRPGVSPFQVMLADRYSFSGDWRYGELLAACSVSVPGFHLDADEEVASLTAAAAGTGMEDLPVVAQAEPALIADASGAPAVLIAAGVVVEDVDDATSAYTAAIDGLGTWLQQELAALRAEIGMTPTPVELFTQVTTAVTDNMRKLRQELGLPVDEAADAAVQQTETGEQQTTETTEQATGEQTGEQQADATTTQEAVANEQAPATEGAAEQAASEQGAAPEATTAAGTLPEIEQFKNWMSGEFKKLIADRKAAVSAAAAAPATTPAVTAETAEFTAKRQALRQEIFGSELNTLFAQVHEGAA